MTTDRGIEIEFQKRTLDNGLQVVVHTDRADPLVAVYVAYHVGSAREHPGLTGFAHLFEHMLFQGSANVPEGEHFKRINTAGGSLNGTTSLDRTVYFETLPKNHLELALWLESDRMGFLLPAMTQKKLDNQRDVVMNERRQNYDNRPYGRVAETVAAALFTPDHPYHWLPIGSMEDIGAATLEDVSAFFRRWYGPNNATLCIAGDVDVERAFELASKWFDSVPRGPAVDPQAPRAARMAAEKRLILEDRVALPQVSLTWAGARQFTPEAAALDLLARILSQNKSSILDRALTVETSLARAVGAGHWGAELAGRFDITVRASPQVALPDLEQRVLALLAQLHERGIDAAQLERMKMRCEAEVVRSLQTVIGRAGSLAEYNLFTGDPGHQRRELALLRAVTPAQVRSALGEFLLSKPAVVLACVPAKQSDGPPATVAMRATPRAEVAAGATAAVPPTLARSGPERSKAPTSPLGPNPSVPEVRLGTSTGGAKSGAASFTRAPWASASLALPMGRRAESAQSTGIASLCAALFSEGTRRHSTTEFTDELDRLGASVSIAADDDEIHYSLSVLDRELEPALDLLLEAALEPRLDPADYERMLTQRRTAIATRGENPGATAGRALARLIHGETPMGRSALSAEATLSNLTHAALGDFHRRGAHSAGARLVCAGPRPVIELEGLARRGLERLPARPADALELSLLSCLGKHRARVFLVDHPGAQQTELRVGHASLSSTHADYFPLSVLNYILGGAFSSRINLNLREQKGYTYGARSYLTGGVLPGSFVVSAAVETSVSAAAAKEILAELALIRRGVRADELAFAQESLRQSLAGQYESCDARRSMVDTALQFGWPADYPLRRAQQLASLSVADLDRLANDCLDPNAWIVLAVGDAKAIEASLGELDLGPVCRLDLDGRELA